MVLEKVMSEGAWSLGSGVFLLLGLWFFSSLRSYQRLRHFRGPWLASFSKLWMMRSTLRGSMHSDVADACKKYGNLARVGPNVLVTDDPELIRKMNSVRSEYSRSDWYDGTAFSHKLSHVFCERNEQRHVDLRNKLIPGYSGRENDHLEQTIDDQMLSFFRLIRERYTSTQGNLREVDFARLCQYIALDIISAVAFGEPMGFVQHDKDLHNYIANQISMLPIFEWFSTLPILQKATRLPGLSQLLMPTPKDKTGAGLLMRYANETVAERFGPNKKTRRDMLGSFVAHGLTQVEAEQETVLQIFAGSDTTATTIRTASLFLISNPPALRKLQTELDQAAQRGELSNPIISYEAAKNLPYLQACIKESLRIWPPVCGLMQKVVPKGGDTIDGKFVPGGTEIGYCAWGVHRNQAVFGSDADLFRPDRWFEENEEKLLAMNRTIDVVFGFGRYSCLGKPVAMIELSKALAEIFYRYEIVLLNPSRPWHSVNRNGLFLQSELMVSISERDPAAGA